MKDQKVKVRSICQPDGWWSAFKDQADAEGMSLSAWIGAQCRKRLPRDVRDQLDQRPETGKWERKNS